MRSIQHVRHSLWRWFRDVDYFLSRLDDIWMVGRQESLEESFARLKQRLGLPDKVALPNDDRQAHRTPLGLNTLLTSAARRNVESWSASDIRLLEICAEHAECLDYRVPGS